MTQMWQPFTLDARSGIVQAQQAAAEFGQNYIGTEHILIGITSTPGSMATQILSALGASAATVHHNVEAALKRGVNQPGEMVFTPGAKRAIEMAFNEARLLNHNYVGTEHLLLGIICEEDGLGARVLRDLNVDRKAVRDRAAMIVREKAPFSTYDHVQLAMPAGKEDLARSFYAGVLGMTEIPKPPERSKRGGVWFASDNVALHLGVDPDFRAAEKAHPALLCNDFAGLLTRLRDAGIDLLIESAPGGIDHGYVHDPFGNRIELIGHPSTGSG